MIGWRARLGFLVPPGNPTVETEMTELAPQGVSLHFHRMMARGIGGALDGQRERNQMMIDHLPDSIELLAMVNPSIIVIAHTATSYHLERLSHDVARAAQRWRAATDSGLRSLVNARVTERAVRYRATGVAALGGSAAPAVCRGKAFFQTACVQAPSGFCATGLLAAEDSTSTVRW